MHIKRGLTIGQALLQSDGLAVVGIWFQIGKNGKALEPIIPAIIADELRFGKAYKFAIGKLGNFGLFL